MSRHGYTDDFWDENANRAYLYRGAVESALRGRRGQAFLRELLAALDALPEPRLISNLLIEDGAVCALGAVGKARGIDMMPFAPQHDAHCDYDDLDDMGEAMAALFGIAPAMAREIMFENDEGICGDETAEKRFARIRRWVVRQIREG